MKNLLIFLISFTVFSQSKTKIDNIVYKLDRSLYNEALNDINNLIINDSSNGDLFYYYFLRGECYLGLENNNKAADDYNESIRLNPNYPHNYFGLGIINARLGNDNSAINFYKKFQELSNYIHDSTSDYNIAQLYKTLFRINPNKNDYENAIDYFSRAIGKNDDNYIKFNSYYEIGYLKKQSNSQNYCNYFVDAHNLLCKSLENAEEWSPKAVVSKVDYYLYEIDICYGPKFAKEMSNESNKYLKLYYKNNKAKKKDYFKNLKKN